VEPQTGQGIGGSVSLRSGSVRSGSTAGRRSPGCGAESLRCGAMRLISSAFLISRFGVPINLARLSPSFFRRFLTAARASSCHSSPGIRQESILSSSVRTVRHSGWNLVLLSSLKRSRHTLEPSERASSLAIENPSSSLASRLRSCSISARNARLLFFTISRSCIMAGLIVESSGLVLKGET